MKKYNQFINGEFASNEPADIMEVVNPSTEEVISIVPKGTREDARKALNAATEAQKKWRQTPAIERAGYIYRISEGLKKKRDDLAKIISEEQGKVFPLAQVEVDITVAFLEYNAEWARRYEGDIIQSDRRGENILIHKLPLGVVAGICPWNFPLALIGRKVGPALVTGNTIVIKPSSITPNNAFEFAKIVKEAELPPGIINVVSGSGGTVGNELARNPMTSLISLTGSVEAGQKIIEASTENVTKVSLELGGKAPAIVCEDADIDLAVRCIVASRILNSGQVCNAAERVYVHEKIADTFIQKMASAMQAVTVADPFTDPAPNMSVLVSKEHLEKVEQMVERAKKDGAEVLTGGKRTAKFGKGYYYDPTVLINCRQDMEIIQREIFGPILPIMIFKGFDQAIEYANDCEYGLTSSIYTNNMTYAMRAANEIKFGETYVNRENGEAVQGFHAGWRKSGIGGADGKNGLNEYLQTHVMYIQYM
jgi:lactaldehyde dehydrogenase/glycolaldehyde dehydrogenase